MTTAIVFALFAWGIIASSIAVEQWKERKRYAAFADRWSEIAADAQDRLQASSLSEYRTHRPIAMPAREPEPPYEYVSDVTGTGLLVERRDPRSE